MKYPSLLFTIVIVFALAVGALTFWWYQPSDVLDIKSPITVAPPVAHNGDPVVLTITYCKNLNVQGQVRISFVGQSVEIFQPMSTDAQSPGCHTGLKIPILLPPASVVPAGKYRIKFHTVYQVNPLKSVSQDFQTEMFEVK